MPDRRERERRGVARPKENKFFPKKGGGGVLPTVHICIFCCFGSIIETVAVAV
jgi:hypothetical protein